MLQPVCMKLSWRHWKGKVLQGLKTAGSPGSQITIACFEGWSNKTLFPLIYCQTHSESSILSRGGVLAECLVTELAQASWATLGLVSTWMGDHKVWLHGSPACWGYPWTGMWQSLEMSGVKPSHLHFHFFLYISGALIISKLTPLMHRSLPQLL